MLQVYKNVNLKTSWRWVAKFVSPPLATAAIWVRILKKTNSVCLISKGVANTLHTANKGPVRIQNKCLVPIYVFPEMKLFSLIISKKLNYNVLSLWREYINLIFSTV